jgi:hypothetical protein
MPGREYHSLNDGSRGQCWQGHGSNRFLIKVLQNAKNIKEKKNQPHNGNYLNTNQNPVKKSASGFSVWQVVCQIIIGLRWIIG